jgi:hypothetical protein
MNFFMYRREVQDRDDAKLHMCVGEAAEALGMYNLAADAYTKVHVTGHVLS